MAEWETDHCKVCHKPIDVEAMRKVRDELADQIYRPGDVITPEIYKEMPKSAKRVEIEEALRLHRLRQQRREK